MEHWPACGSEEDEREFARLWSPWNGEAEVRNRRGAVRGLMKLAEGGYAPEQYALGMAYFDGEGVRRDYQKAFEWLMRSAERGYPGAQNMVGSFYGSVAPKRGVASTLPWKQSNGTNGQPALETPLPR